MKTEQHKITVNEQTTVSSVWQIPEHYQAVLIIAHGAGNDMNSGFISFLHENFAEQGLLTVKFNFPYKEQQRQAPDQAPVLEATWRAVIDTVRQKTGCDADQIFISGKSMGGRYASVIASRDIELGGVILFGYPLHSPGKPDKLRAEHLAKVRCPMLFIQGTRDSLCQLDKLQHVLAPLKPLATLHLVVGGDHSFRILKRLNRSEAAVLDEIVQTTCKWIEDNI